MHLDLDNARYQDQKDCMNQIIADGQSPFLPKNLAKYHSDPIIKQGKFWYITKNQWPYQNTLHHYLIISNLYWTQITDLDPQAGPELIEFTQWLCQHLQVPGGAICLRFGDTNYSGGTIDHLHWQFIVPNLKAPTYERVKFSIGKKRSKLSP